MSVGTSTKVKGGAGAFVEQAVTAFTAEDCMMEMSTLLISIVVLLSVISACAADKEETPPPSPPLPGMPMQGHMMGPGMMGPGMMGPGMMGPGMMGPGMMGPGVRGQVLPESQSAGAKLVKRYCTQCHSLPSPAQHTADAWPAVVARMQAHMQETRNNGTMPIRLPSQSKIKEIIGYLQKHAS
jgi:hypothetical protein